MSIRYERQIKINEIGEEGQKKLKNSKALVVGAGGLGSPALYYLSAAGVGHIGISWKFKPMISWLTTAMQKIFLKNMILC